MNRPQLSRNNQEGNFPNRTTLGPSLQETLGFEISLCIE